MLQHPVPDALLVRIGDVTVSFALLESAVQSLVGGFIQDSQRVVQIITAGVSFRDLRALATSLYRERHGGDADFETLVKLMKRAAELEERRNQISHSIWGAGRGPDTITRIKATAKKGRGYRAQFEQMSSNDLAEVADGMKRLAGEIQAFWIYLIEARKAINDRSQRLWTEPVGPEG